MLLYDNQPLINMAIEVYGSIRKGALDKTDMKDMPLRYNHNDTCLIMARTKRNKSLQ